MALTVKYLNPAVPSYNSFLHHSSQGLSGFCFTHGVRLGGQVAEKIGPGCISETVRSRKWILGRDIG